MKRIFACLMSALLLPSCIFPADDSKGVEYPSPLVLTELKVTLTRASIYIGQTTTAVATGKDQFANAIATGPVTYASSNLAAATISQDGMISALSPGLATITATTATKHAETLLQVSAPSVLAALYIAIPTQTVRVGFASPATLIGEDQYGAPFTPANVVWTTSAPNVATVSQSGVVTGVTIGQATIRAQSAGVTANATLNVISATPTVQSVVLNGAKRVKVGDDYAYTPIVTRTDGTIANLPVTFGLAPTSDGLITSNGHFTPFRTGPIGINATVSNATFTTYVLGYNWSKLALFGGPNAEVEIESDAAVVRAGVDRYPYLSVSCTVITDPQNPELNIGIGGINVRGDTASTAVLYSIDGAATQNETWNGPRALTFSSVYSYVATTNAARVEFVRAVASGKTFTFTFKQTLEGPKSMSFRLSGMQAAIAPVLAACGVN